MTQQISHRAPMLVAEDDPIIRMMLVDALEDEGFEILEAGTVTEALVHLKSRPDICVLVTDVEMPGELNGYNLATRALSSHPELVIIIISGRLLPRAGDVPSGVSFLRKPFRIDEILSHIPSSVYLH